MTTRIDRYINEIGVSHSTSPGDSSIRFTGASHEISDNPGTSEFEIKIDVADRLIVRRQLAGVASTAVSDIEHSDEYLAAKRRRQAQAIYQSFSELSQHFDSEDFEAWTHRILDSVRHLLHALTKAQCQSKFKSEGNSCEVLRQIRDSLMRVGWKKYRDHAARKAAMQAIEPLTELQDVGPDIADNAFDILTDAGLEAVLEPMMEAGNQIPH